MEILSDFLKLFTTPEGFKQMITWGGYPVLCLIIFSETGLLIGFFLPGDSLLVTAGLLSSAGYLNISYLILLLIPCAIIGDALGYYIGKKGGRKLYDRPESRFFKKVHLEKLLLSIKSMEGKL